MPKFRLSRAPVALTCLEKSDTELSALLRMSAITIEGAAWLINVCRDETKKSENHWIEITTSEKKAGYLVIRVFTASSRVELEYKQHGVENIKTIDHPCLITNNIVDMIQQVPAWSTALQTLNAVWEAMLLNFRIATARRTSDEKQPPKEFRLEITGKPTGSRVRERLPINFWDMNPVINWRDSRIELPAGAQNPKRTVWSDVGVVVEGQNHLSGIALKQQREANLYKWLKAEANIHPYNPRPKAEYLVNAKQEFDFLKTSEFERVWGRVCAKMQKETAGKAKWGRPGPPRP